MATAVKSGILFGILGGVAVAGMSQDTRERYQAALAAPPPPAAVPITTAIAQWKAVQQTDSLPFDSYAGFLLAHPGWPNETANRRAAEKQAGSPYAQPASVVRFFRRYPPLTAAGGIAFARALRATGAGPEADAAAAAAWRRGSLPDEVEAATLSEFAGALRPADHDARMDALLWQGATAAARRQLPLTSPAARPVLAARLALRTGGADAAAHATASDPALVGDAGFVADKARWLRNNNASAAARSWLARPRGPIARPGDVEEFYEVLLTNARGAVGDRQWQTAYDIARQVDDAYPAGTDVSRKPYGERDDYTSLVWLAGTVALKELRRPLDAVPMFDRYGRGSLAPQTRAKGFYWAGRAAEAGGRAADARGYFERAAGYREQYYGQLALERLGRPLAAPPPAPAIAVGPAARSAFDARETVQAARFLGSIGQWQDQTAFVRQIAADVETAEQAMLAVDLARTMGRPDLAVLVGRGAMQDGRPELSAVAFPTMAVPTGQEANRSIIHAITRQESQFDREAVSHAGARGLMQLMPGTAREQAGRLGLSYDAAALTRTPSYNIALGIGYFERIHRIYGSYPLAIAAYNAGPGNVNRWLRANGDPRTGQIEWVDWVEAIPFLETRNYVQRVLENAVVYDLMDPSHARSRGPANLSWYLGKSRPG